MIDTYEEMQRLEESLHGEEEQSLGEDAILDNIEEMNAAVVDPPIVDPPIVDPPVN